MVRSSLNGGTALIRRTWIFLAIWGLIGCRATLPPPVMVPNTPIIPVVLPVAVALPIDEEEEEFSGLSTDQVITQALKKARRVPVTKRFKGGMLVYRFQPHAIFRLDTAVDHHSVIELQPGERLMYMGLADTKRWIVDETVSGEGATRQVLLLVKPEALKLKTTITLATNWGRYLIEAFSNERTYIPAMSWSHPRRRQTAMAEMTPEPTRYQIRVMTTPAPSWVPRRAWNDRTFLHIQCDVSLRTTQAPVPGIVRDGVWEVINYELIGTKYKIHRLLATGEVMELRVGHEEQAQVVRVERMEETP